MLHMVDELRRTVAAEPDEPAAAAAAAAAADAAAAAAQAGFIRSNLIPSWRKS